MFAKTIIDSDAFLDMPLSTQALYMHLSMRADDDGFVNNPKRIQRMIGASDDDLRVLLAKSFILSFETGVIVIKHWRINNYLRNDRYKPTPYQDEMQQLTTKENGAYTLSESVGIPNGYQMDTQVSIGKDSKDKNSKESRRFTPPTLDEVRAYCQERGNNVNPQTFYDYYTEGKWKDGSGKPVKNWKQKLITWERRESTKPAPKSNKFNEFEQNTYNYDELEKMLVSN